MSWARRVAALLVLMLGSWASTGAASAQTFEERWSPIPKAHAEPSPAPRANSAPDANEPAVPNPESVDTPRAEVPKTSTKSSSRSRPAARRVFTGRASYYAYHGGRPARGQPFSPFALTAGQRALPLGN